MIFFNFCVVLNVIEVISRLSFEIRPIEIWETFSVSGFFERENLFILSIVEESRYESGRFYQFYDLKKIPPFLILLKPFQLKELNSKSWNSWICTLTTTDIRGGRRAFFECPCQIESPNWVWCDGWLDYSCVFWIFLAHLRESCLGECVSVLFKWICLWVHHLWHRFLHFASILRRLRGWPVGCV